MNTESISQLEEEKMWMWNVLSTRLRTSFQTLIFQDQLIIQETWALKTRRINLRNFLINLHFHIQHLTGIQNRRAKNWIFHIIHQDSLSLWINDQIKICFRITTTIEEWDQHMNMKALPTKLMETSIRQESLLNQFNSHMPMNMEAKSNWKNNRKIMIIEYRWGNTNTIKIIPKSVLSLPAMMPLNKWELDFNLNQDINMTKHTTKENFQLMINSQTLHAPILID